MCARGWILGLVGTVALTAGPSGEQAPRLPIYVQLVSTFEDHINVDLSEERLRRTLPLLASLRQSYAAYEVSCLYQFTGLAAERLEDRSSNGLYDAVLRATHDGLLEIGYDGWEEPTFVARPRPDFRGRRTPEERWAARTRALDLFLTEGKDARTGEPEEGKRGGLALVQSVFGSPRSAWGINLELGADAELVHVLRRLGVDPLLPGTPLRDTYPARNLHGFRGSAAMLGQLVSPVEDTAPEVFWRDHALRVSDLTVEGTGPVIAHKGVDAFKALLEKLDPSRPHVVRVRLGEPGVYAKRGFGRRQYVTPLEYAYDNPKDAGLPDDARLSREDSDAAYGREEALLRWLVTDFFPANPGSRFVSAARLREMVGPESGFAVGGEAFVAAIGEFLRAWTAQGTNPPSYAVVEGHYLSLADVFGLLADALDAKARSGRVPDTLSVRPVLGPLEIGDDGEQVGRRVAVGAVAQSASTLLPRLADVAWRPVPTNIVPSEIRVGDVTVTAAQFLRLMAEALLASSPEAELTVARVDPMSALGIALARSRPLHESGNTWTMKPARLRPRPIS